MNEPCRMARDRLRPGPNHGIKMYGAQHHGNRLSGWQHWVLGVLIVWPLWCGRLSAAIYLQLDGIPGEVLDPDHEGWIEVLGFDWQSTQTATRVQPSGRLDIKDLTLHKYLDKASPLLMRALYQGHQIGQGKIRFIEPVNGKLNTVLGFELTNILVTDYQTGAADGAAGVLETIHLLFDQFEETVYSFSDDGTPTGQSLVFWTASAATGGSSGIPNTAPTISTIPHCSTPEDTAKTVGFTIGDHQTPSGALIVTRGSSNPSLVPVSNIVLGGSGSNRTALIIPSPNQTGTAVIQIEVSDGVLKASSQFTLTVTPVNDPPALPAIATQITRSSVPVVLSVTISDIDSDPALATLAGTSNNTTLLPNSNIGITGNTATRTVTLNPVPGLSGEALVTLTATDNAGAPSVPVSFSLIVNPVGERGLYDIILNASVVEENSPGGTEVARIKVLNKDVSASHVLTLVEDAGGRFVIGGTTGDRLFVAAGADLNYEAAASHGIVVKATDPEHQWYSKAFTITVTNVNEPPKIGLAELPKAATGSPGVLTGIDVNDVDAGTNPALTLMQVSHGILTINATGRLAGRVVGNGSACIKIDAVLGDVNSVLAAGGLIYQSAVGFTGTETLVIQIDDQGASGTGGPQLATASGTFEVTASGFEAFRIQHFSVAELLNPALSGPDADPDHDRLANLGEYALGGDPHDGRDAGRLVEWLWIDDLTHRQRPALRFLCRIDDPQLDVKVEVATDMVNWHSGVGFTYQVEVVPDVPGFPGFQRVTARSERSTADEPRQFLRLRIARVP